MSGKKIGPTELEFIAPLSLEEELPNSKWKSIFARVGVDVLFR